MSDLEILNALLTPQPWTDELGDIAAEGVCPVCEDWVEFSVNLATDKHAPWDIARCTECNYEAPCDLDHDEDAHRFFAELLNA